MEQHNTLFIWCDKKNVCNLDNAFDPGSSFTVVYFFLRELYMVVAWWSSQLRNQRKGTGGRNGYRFHIPSTRLGTVVWQAGKQTAKLLTLYNASILWRCFHPVRGVLRFRTVVATTDRRCCINLCMHILEVILYWLVTNNGGHFKPSGGWSWPLPTTVGTSLPWILFYDTDFWQIPNMSIWALL